MAPEDANLTVGALLRTMRVEGRDLSEHKCSGKVRKLGDECYLCLDCGAILQIPNDPQMREEQAN